MNPIDTDELVPRGVYEIYCRNLAVGVWNGKDGFVGIREKFGSRFLDKEHPWTEDRRYRPYDTVRRVGPLLAMVPTSIESLEEYLGSECIHCGKPARWTGPPAPAPWECDGGCEDVRSQAVHNQDLFMFLNDVQKAHTFSDDYH